MTGKTGIIITFIGCKQLTAFSDHSLHQKNWKKYLIFERINEVLFDGCSLTN